MKINLRSALRLAAQILVPIAVAAATARLGKLGDKVIAAASPKRG